MQENISQEQKIDYIYEILKKNEKKAKWALIFKWGFRIFMIIYLIYFIKIGLPLMIDSFMPAFSSENSINTSQIQEMISEYLSK